MPRNNTYDMDTTGEGDFAPVEFKPGRFSGAVLDTVYPGIATTEGDVYTDGVFIVKSEDAMFGVADVFNDAGDTISVTVPDGVASDDDPDLVELGDVTFEHATVAPIPPEVIGAMVRSRTSFISAFVRAASSAANVRFNVRRLPDYESRISFIRSDSVPDNFQFRKGSDGWANLRNGQLVIIIDGTDRKRTVDFITNIFEDTGLAGVTLIVADYENQYGSELFTLGTDYIFTVE